MLLEGTAMVVVMKTKVTLEEMMALMRSVRSWGPSGVYL